MDEYMNILFYGSYPPPYGGIANHVRDFAKYIKENTDHNAFFFGNTKERESPYCKIINKKYPDFSSSLRLMKKLIILKNDNFYYSNFKNKIAHLLKASIFEQILQQYNIDAIFIYHFPRGKIFSLIDKNIRNNVISVLTFFGEYYSSTKTERRDFKEIAANFDLVFSCSKHCMDSFFKLKNVEKIWGEKLDYIYYGVPAKFNINKDNISSKIRAICKNNEIIFNLANHLEIMGQDLIIKAVKEIDKKEIRNIKFVIAGHNFPFVSKLEDLISRYDLEKHAILLGALNEDEKNFLIEKSLFAIISTRTDIACSSVFAMESMRASKPILISKVGGNTEMIEEQKSGEFFRNNDYLELSKKILKFIKNRDLLYKYGNLSRGIFRKKFINHRCFELYLTALSKSRGEKNG